MQSSGVSALHPLGSLPVILLSFNTRIWLLSPPDSRVYHGASSSQDQRLTVRCLPEQGKDFSSDLDALATALLSPDRQPVGARRRVMESFSLVSGALLSSVQILDLFSFPQGSIMPASASSILLAAIQCLASITHEIIIEEISSS